MSNFSGHIALKGRESSEFEQFRGDNSILYSTKGMSTHPTTPISFDRHKDEAKAIFYHLRSTTWMHKFPCSNKLLKLWIEWLQYFTYFWSFTDGEKAISLEDIFEGCLLGGPDFAAWLKKTRAYSLQAKWALNKTNLPEEYVLEDWECYDSLPPESSLIHWIEEVNDFPWSLIPLRVKQTKEEIFVLMEHTICTELPSHLRIYGMKNVYSVIKPSKVYDPNLPKKSKTRLMRDIFLDLQDPEEGWHGKRVTIQAMPGGCRDGTVATPSTLLKIKLASEIFKHLCEANIYSAMASHRLSRKRINRVRQNGKLFLHWDFKKVGLCCPRVNFLALAMVIEKYFAINMDWFDFEHLYVTDGKATISTARGYALGWMNEGITIVIIHWLLMFFRQIPEWKNKFDFVVFNDDVEIAIKHEMNDYDMTVLKISLLEHFKLLDVPCSTKKIFFSRQSIFLEEYWDPDIDDELPKNSIAARMYAKAIMNSIPFVRKTFVNIASQIWIEPVIINLIKSRTKKEFDNVPRWYDESFADFDSGGWFTSYEDNFRPILRDNPNYAFLAQQLAKAVIEIDTKKIDTKFKWRDTQNKSLNMMSAAHGPLWYETPREEFDESFQSLETFEESLASMSLLSRQHANLEDLARSLYETSRQGIG